jgi:hypothetical protein
MAYSRSAAAARAIWTPAMAMPPSPTAAAQRFTEPERTSPAAKTPGRLVFGRHFTDFTAPERAIKNAKMLAAKDEAELSYVCFSRTVLSALPHAMS